VCISTLGSTFDTVLYVHQRVCNDGQLVACNDDDDDDAGGPQSRATLEVLAGEDYFIFVDGHRIGLAGDYTLEISAGACAP
jgi:hypothetical protein